MNTFQNDRVENWTPVEFSIEFTRRMRKDPRVNHPPSLRTALAIPRFLTARYFRLRVLTPKDYLEAAILNTVPEDQEWAEHHARELLFPKPSKEGEAGTRPAAPGPPKQVAAKAADPTAGILSDLASLNIDFDSLEDLSDIEETLSGTGQETLGAFDLFERLYSSADASERALAELTVLFGGPAELEAVGATSRERVEQFLESRLSSQIGALRPEHILHGTAAGFEELLLKETSVPWEVAGTLAGAAPHRLGAFLESLAGSGTAREMGRTHQFLKPFEGTLDRPLMARFREQCRNRPRDLADLVEMVSGLEEWLEPAEELLNRSVEENAVRAIDAASWIAERFDRDLRPDLLDRWLARLTGQPTLFDLAHVVVDCERWRALVKRSLGSYVKALQSRVKDTTVTPDLFGGVPEPLTDAVSLAEALERSGTEAGSDAAGQISTRALCLVAEAEHFLPLLDDFLERGVLPGDVKAVVDAGTALGISPEEIYDRIGDALRQLELSVRGNGRDAARYQRLVDRVKNIPDELLAELCAIALRHDNLEAMAALLALNLGGACQHLPEKKVADALCYKGIGGGPNLLRQWYGNRISIHGPLRGKIKEVTRHALLDLAFDWMGKGAGSGNKGLVPQSQCRPFQARDDLDSLDIENTLDSVIMAGKRLADVTLDDLFVQDTARGQGALAVLIDISGSMTGDDLATCAIAVVMLLGRVRSEEIALAVFESNTHVIKSFDEGVDLSDVADEVLELEASGGTCVDAALEWTRLQFARATQAEFRLLFLLSDFYFSEGPEELSRHGLALADLGVRFLGASHRNVNRNNLETLERTIGGQTLSLGSVKKLPSVLIETLQQIGDGAFRR